MNDVIPECGGYLPVYVEASGYIVGIESEACVHRETRDADKWRGCFKSFADAKAYVLDMPGLNPFKVEATAILQLTSEGGGEAIWALPDDVPVVTALRDRWRGCYGAWPVHTFSVSS